MKVTFELESEESVSELLTVEANAQETLESITKKAAEALKIEPSELLVSIGGDEPLIVKDHSKKWCIPNIHLRFCPTVCVEVHYQSEPPVRRLFTPFTKWVKVHEWACKQFEVADCFCQDLELVEGGPDGQALNEKAPIGFSRDCKTIWLINPGPECNG